MIKISLQKNFYNFRCCAMNTNILVFNNYVSYCQSFNQRFNGILSYVSFQLKYVESCLLNIYWFLKWFSIYILLLKRSKNVIFKFIVDLISKDKPYQKQSIFSYIIMFFGLIPELKYKLNLFQPRLNFNWNK